MLTDLLWFLGAKQQYDKQKQQGLAGLMGILFVIFMVWKWDELFYPILDKLGLVAMAGRVGLIHDLPVMTVINVIAMIFLLAIFFAIALVVISVGQYLLILPMAVILLPFKLIKMMFLKKQSGVKVTGFATPEAAYKRNTELTPLISQYKNEKSNMKMFRYYEEQVNRSDESGSVTLLKGEEKVKNVLQRVVASIKDDREWLVYYHESTEQWYILFPNPLPEFASPAFKSDYLSYSDKTLYDFDMLGVSKFMGEPSPYVVPGLPISFEWTGTEITPKIIQEKRDIVEVKVEWRMKTYQIKTSAMKALFDEVAQLGSVERAMKEAILALYIIPIAHPINPLSTSTQEFLDEVATIPFADIYAPIYAADVEERMIKYAEYKKEFAINWLKSSV